MCIYICILIHFIINDFYCPSGSRTPQNLMTTVPEKVWPGARVPYIFDLSEWNNYSLVFENAHAHAYIYIYIYIYTYSGLGYIWGHLLYCYNSGAWVVVYKTTEERTGIPPINCTLNIL